jgi:hypothetical protein
MQSRTIALDALILLLAVIIFYNGFLSAERITPGSDMTNLFYPMKYFAQKTLRSGIIPLWNPWTFCGTPFLATLQSSPFYPLDFLILDPRNLALTINLYKVLHLWLLAYFFYLFLASELRLVRWAALLAAMVYPLSGFFWGHTEHINQLAAITWFPLAVTLERSYLRSGKRAVLPALTLVYGVQWLAGHPQYSVYSGFFLLFYALCWLLLASGCSLAGRLRKTLWVIAALAAGFALSLVQTLPGQELARFSYRIFNDFEYAAGFSMKPAYLISFLPPSSFSTYQSGLQQGDNLSEYGCYIGIVPLALVLVGAYAALRKRKGEIVFFLLSALVALLFALGRYTPVFRLFYAALPPLGQFRVPARMLFLVSFLLLTVAAYGLDVIAGELARSQRNWKMLAPALAAIICVRVFGDLYAASQNSFFRYPVKWKESMHEREPWYPLRQDTDYFRTFRLMVNDMQFYDAIAAPALAGRLQRLQPNSNMLYNLALVDGYEEGLLPTVRFKDFMLTYNRNFRSARPDSALLALMNVKYIYADGIMQKDNLYVQLPVVSERFRAVRLPGDWEKRLPYRLYENLDWRGGVFWLRELEARYDLARLDGTYYRWGKLMTGYADTLQKYQKAESSNEPLDAQRGLRIWYYSPNEIHVRKLVNQVGDLCVSQATYPGWVAISGDMRAPLKPLNAILSSFPAQAGKTTIWLRYEPFSFRLGLFLSLFVLIALFIFLIGFCP